MSKDILIYSPVRTAIASVGGSFKGTSALALGAGIPLCLERV